MINKEKYQKRLNRIADNLNKLLEEIRVEYSDANYMLNGGCISIMIDKYAGGESSSEHGQVVTSKHINYIDSGDWS